MSFSNDIKMIRHKCLMSQIEFAEALGCRLRLSIDGNPEEASRISRL